MNRTPIAALAFAFSLAFVPALAAQPLAGIDAEAVSTGAGSAVPAQAKEPIVSIVRKVYFFNQLDRNHNGFLSRAELPKDMVQLRRDFVRADFDGNGQLSRQEILLYEREAAPQTVGPYHVRIFVYQEPKRGITLSLAP